MVKLRKFFEFRGTTYNCFDYHVKGTEREVSVVRMFIHDEGEYMYVVWYKDGGSRQSHRQPYKGEKPGTLVRRHIENIGAAPFPFIGGICL